MSCLRCVFHVSAAGSWIHMGLTTGGSGNSTAPSPGGPWEAFPSTSPQGHRRGAVGQGEHRVPLLWPASRRSSSGANGSHGRLGEAGSARQLQELAAGWCWNGMQCGRGFTARCLPKGKGWGGMEVSGGAALLACALGTLLQAQLRMYTGSDIE